MDKTLKKIEPLIESYWDSMTDTEQTIAHFFITNTSEKDVSSGAICQRLHVSKASLTRFAKKCGFSGYREFIFSYQESKLHLKGESSTLKNNVTKRVMADYEQLLEKTYSVIDEQQLTRITRLIEEANRIYLYGKGSSAQALKEMKTRFMRLGFDFDIVTDNDELIWSSMLVGPDCLVIAASLSGKTKSVINALMTAKERGAKTVLMTTQIVTQRDDSWDELVLLASRDNLSYGNCISPQFPILLLIDCLFAYQLAVNQDEKQKRYHKTIISYKEEL